MQGSYIIIQHKRIEKRQQNNQIFFEIATVSNSNVFEEDLGYDKTLIIWVQIREIWVVWWFMETMWYDDEMSSTNENNEFDKVSMIRIKLKELSSLWK